MAKILIAVSTLVKFTFALKDFTAFVYLWIKAHFTKKFQSCNKNTLLHEDICSNPTLEVDTEKPIFFLDDMVLPFLL